MNLRYSFLLLFTVSVLTAIGQTNSATAPSRLAVDLVEHTGRVWINGYLSDITLPQAGTLPDPYQVAEISPEQPVFSWVVNDTGKNILQTAFQVLVASSSELLGKDSADMWNSGKTAGDNSVAVKYAGKKLNPAGIYYWKVKTWNNGRETPYSDIKAFKTSAADSKYGSARYPLQKDDMLPADLMRINKGMWFADFGKAAFGRLRVTLLSERPDTLTIHLGEALKNGRLDRNPGGTIRYRSIRLHLIPGLHTYVVTIPPDSRNTGPAAIKMPGYTGEVLPFRYCEIEGFEGDIHRQAVVRETVHYPFDETAAAFKSSDQALNDVWEFCKYSIKATSFTGFYVDGDRERIPYEADALINQLCHYSADREYTMARNSLAYLAEHATWPTEWSLQLVLIAWYDYLYTGNDGSIRYFYDILKAKTLLALAAENGLISTRTGKQTPGFLKSINFSSKELSDIVDWPHTGILGLGKNEAGETDGYVFTDYNTVVNAFHYKSLVVMAQIAGQLGIMEDADFFALQSVKVKKSFNKYFFDNKRKIYIDGIGTDHASQHANFFPLALGLVEPENYRSVLEFVKSRGMACSVYGAQFLLDAVYNGNDAAYGLELLTSTSERSWTHMIYDVGATISLEAWDNKYKPNQDWNHAWGAAPANLIPRRLMGIEPVEAGFRKFIIKPQPGTLEYAAITLPTVRGDVKAAFNNKPGQAFELNITIPANSAADVYIPCAAKPKFVLMDNTKVKYQKDGDFIIIKNIGSGNYQFTVQQN